MSELTGNWRWTAKREAKTKFRKRVSVPFNTIEGKMLKVAGIPGISFTVSKLPVGERGFSNTRLCRVTSSGGYSENMKWNTLRFWLETGRVVVISPTPAEEAEVFLAAWNQSKGASLAENI